MAMWAALFGALGFNFLDLGNSVISGIIFELMALGGLVGALAIFVDWLRAPKGQPVFDYSGVVMAGRTRR